MALTKAVILGGIGAIGIPFMMGDATGSSGSILATMMIHGPNGASLPWSWPVFCFVTGIAWACFRIADG